MKGRAPKGGGKSISLHWLRQPLVEIEGLAAKFETRKSTALLAYLSMSDRPYSRESLASVFWADFDEERAPANLRRALFSLNSILGEGVIEASRDGVGLAAGAVVANDAMELRRLVQEGKEAGDAVGEEALARAIALYEGDFLEGFNLGDCPAFEEWQYFQREGFRRDIAWALERSIGLDAIKDRWGEAVAKARRWIAIDGLDERARRAYMSVLAGSGQRNAALRQFEDCDRTLRKELGVGASPETVRLARAIREGRLPLRVAAGGDGVLAIRPEPDEEPSLPLLRTKSFIPYRSGTLLERSRLVRLLDEAIERPLTLLTAPAGFGKSSLAAEWARGSGRRVAWLSLDPDDADPGRFLLYLAAALGEVDARLGKEAMEMLRSPAPPPNRAVVSTLINDIEAIDLPLVLCLDDYQFVSSPPVDETLAYLVDRMPATSRVVAISRSDPALPLARMRSRGLLSEIRADELRFTREEAGAFLRGPMGLSLSDEDVGRLERKTEGWIAGLQIAAIDLRNRDDPGAVIERFSGQDRRILEYFMEEVIDRQPRALREFLISSSVLERLCDSLCGHVAGVDEDGAFLERLAKAGLFLMPLDDEGLWYRYHQLFRDFLGKRLSQERGPGEIRELHLRAGTWLQEKGLNEEAVKHFIAAGDCRSAGELIVKRAGSIAERGDFGSALKWIETLPADLVAGWPELRFVKTKYLLYTERIAEAEIEARSLLDSIADLPKDDRKALLEAKIGFLRGYLAYYANDFSAAESLMAEAEASCPDRDDPMLGFAYFIIIMVNKARLEWGLVDSIFRKAALYSERSCDFWWRSQTVAIYARILRTRGRPHEADEMLREVLQVARDGGMADFISLAMVYSEIAEIESDRGDYVSAQIHVAEALNRVERWNSPTHIIGLHMTAFRVALGRGDRDAALTHIDKADSLIRAGLGLPGFRCRTVALRARLIYASGDLAAAGSWLAGARPESTPGPEFKLLILMACARLRFLRAAAFPDDLDEALALLASLVRETESKACGGQLIEALALQSLAYRLKGDKGVALAALGKALDLAEPEGFLSVFLEEGGAMAELLRLGLGSGAWSSIRAVRFAKRLLAGFGAVG